MDSYQKNILEFAGQLGPKGLVPERLAALRGARPDALVICGMGGSGLAGDLVNDLRAELGFPAPAIIWKNYSLPELPRNIVRPLYVFVSFSGNTEETISGITKLLAAQGLNLKTRVAVITTGGKLEAIARKANLPLITFPAGTLTPRQAVGRMFYALTEIMFVARLIPRRPKTFTHLRPAAFRAGASVLAKKIRGRIPLIYTDDAHRSLGYIWKIKFNETAKIHAFANIIPEMDHNELTAFDAPAPAKIVAIFLTAKPSGRLEKKFHITKTLVARHGVKAIEVPLTGASALERAWRTLLLVDWTSYLLGKALGIPAQEFDLVNPKIVKDLKLRMK